MSVRDLTGQTSGMLTVVERAVSNERRDSMWRCRCSCGNEKTVVGYNLTGGRTKSCGCAQYAARPSVAAIDMTGRCCGKLTVIERNGRKSGEPVWLCKCDCGNETRVPGSRLRRGETRSCGCGARQGIHGQGRQGAVTPAYVTWQAMVKRCEYPGRWNFKYWGGKGIKVCERWRHGDGKRSGFELFYADMGPKPFGLSLDRIDCDGNYEPSNVRWTTRIGQARNRRPSQQPLARGASGLTAHAI